jgi:hypothetical protein
VTFASLAAALARPLFPRSAVLENFSRDLKALTSFAHLLQPPLAFNKGSIVRALETERVEVPSHRPMTDWERQDIADRVAMQLRPRWNQLDGIVDVELLEPDEGAGDATLSEPALQLRCESARHQRGPRKLAEPPTELTLRAQELLRKMGRRYSMTRMTSVVVEMIRAGRAGELGATFELEKSRLRKWVKDHRYTRSGSFAQNNKGVVPQPSTLENNIKSLEPIYQVLAADFRPNFDANSGVL